MPRLRPIAAYVLASALLLACTAPAPRPQITVKPHSEVRHTAGARVDHYELGRYYQAHGKRGLAMDAYLHALELDNRHAAARSALAELYSQEGRLSEAETLLREVIAQGPAAAYLHNNLGYIYFLQGNDVAAIRQLRTALSLEPNHEWARNNLRLAEAMLDRRLAANIQPTPRQAETTAKAFEVWGEASRLEAKMERNLDTALGTLAESAKPRTPDAAPRGDVVARALSEPPVSHKQVAQILSISLPKLRESVRLAKAQRNAEAMTVAPVAATRGKFRLEVSNGNGVRGFAMRVSQILVRQGIAVHSLTNQLPFQQVTTEIQYRDGFEREAEQLRNTLRGYAIVVSSGTPRSWVDLRVVLGKDITARMAEIEAEKPAHIAISKPSTEQL